MGQSVNLSLGLCGTKLERKILKFERTRRRWTECQLGGQYEHKSAPDNLPGKKSVNEGKTFKIAQLRIFGRIIVTV